MLLDSLRLLPTFHYHPLPRSTQHHFSPKAFLISIPRLEKTLSHLPPSLKQPTPKPILRHPCAKIPDQRSFSHFYTYNKEPLDEDWWL